MHPSDCVSLAEGPVVRMIPSSISGLHTSISHLENLVTELVDRVSPAVRNEPVEASSCCKPGSPCGSSVKLVNDIDSASIRVEAVSSRVNDLLKTLEL